MNKNDTSKLEMCDGACFGRFKTLGGKKMVVAGCLSSETETCTGDIAAGEVCKATGDIEVNSVINCYYLKKTYFIFICIIKT